MSPRQNERRPSGSSTRMHSPPWGTAACHFLKERGDVSVWIAVRDRRALAPRARVSAWVPCLRWDAVTTSLPPPLPEPINLAELNQVAGLVKHYENRVPRFSVQRSKNPFVFSRLEMRGSLPACYFCFTNVHSHYIISKAALAVK